MNKKYYLMYLLTSCFILSCMEKCHAQAQNCTIFAAPDCPKGTGKPGGTTSTTADCSEVATGGGYWSYQWGSDPCANLGYNCTLFSAPNCPTGTGIPSGATSTAVDCDQVAAGGGYWSYQWGTEACVSLGQSCTIFSDPACSASAENYTETTSTEALCSTAASSLNYWSYQWGTEACVSFGQNCTLFSASNCLAGTGTPAPTTPTKTDVECFEQSTPGTYPSSQWGSSPCFNLPTSHPIPNPASKRTEPLKKN